MQHKRYWQCQFSAWGLIFVYECITNYLSGRELQKELPWSLLSASLGILFTHLYRIVVLKKHQWSLLSIQQLAKRMFLSSIVIGSLLALYQCVQAVIISQERASFHAYFFLVFFIYTFSLAMNWNLIYFIIKYIAHNRQLSTEKIEMDLLNKNLELNNIKLNLQPHFIFNALNGIRSLILENQNKAREAVMQLSNILRNSLVSNKAELVSLASEITLVKDYLSLESIRYEERLHVNYTINDTCIDSLIPPMLLQTLIENAIKHGIALAKNGGTINLSILPNKDTSVIITIENTGKYLPTKNVSASGFGIASTIKRLYFLYGNHATLHISNTIHHSVICTLTIPKKIC
jgi:two-component system, LytTR family, sensor kinase